jgi:hypothetical protein
MSAACGCTVYGLLEARRGLDPFKALRGAGVAGLPEGFLAEVVGANRRSAPKGSGSHGGESGGGGGGGGGGAEDSSLERASMRASRLQRSGSYFDLGESAKEEEALMQELQRVRKSSAISTQELQQAALARAQAQGLVPADAGAMAAAGTRTSLLKRLSVAASHHGPAAGAPSGASASSLFVAVAVARASVRLSHIPHTAGPGGIVTADNPLSALSRSGAASVGVVANRQSILNPSGGGRASMRPGMGKPGGTGGSAEDLSLTVGLQMPSTPLAPTPSAPPTVSRSHRMLIAEPDTDNFDLPDRSSLRGVHAASADTPLTPAMLAAAGLNAQGGARGSLAVRSDFIPRLIRGQLQDDKDKHLEAMTGMGDGAWIA